MQVGVNSHTNFINDAMNMIDIQIKTLGSHTASTLSSNVWNVSFLSSAMFTEDPIDVKTPSFHFTRNLFQETNR